MAHDTERVRSGQYKVGEIEAHRRDPPETVGVIRGDVVNDLGCQGFGRMIGVNKSKWYVYKQREELRQYYDRSGTGVLMIAELVAERDTKGEAVDKAERYV